MLVLIGFMGAGKSTVGALLAERLGMAFIDIDATIEAHEGRTIADIFASDGEAHFRQREHAQLVAVLDSATDTVVACGGGAIEHAATRAALADATVIYLATSLEAARARVGDDARRPMLQRDNLEAVFARRLHHYQSVADITIDTALQSPDDVVTAIIEQLDARG